MRTAYRQPRLWPLNSHTTGGGRTEEEEEQEQKEREEDRAEMGIIIPPYLMPKM